jgi:hypothetical protein
MVHDCFVHACSLLTPVSSLGLHELAYVLSLKYTLFATRYSVLNDISIIAGVILKTWQSFHLKQLIRVDTFSAYKSHRISTLLT